MAINISNILTQLNTKMTSDSSSTTTELLRRVQAYNSLNNIGVLQYKSYRDLPDVDSSNIGQIVYVSGSEDDSFGTFFFARAIADDYGNITSVDSLNAGWQKIVLNANDSDNFANITDRRLPDFTYQGLNYGYASAGYTPVSPFNSNVIQKYSFAFDGNSADVGDLAVERKEGASPGPISTTHGYVVSGDNVNLPVMPAAATIEKFSFATDGNGTGVGDLANRQMRPATGNSSGSHGYVTGGGPASVAVNDIQKFPVSADANATDVGDLTTTTTGQSGGASSTTHGYRAGGANPTNLNVIDKFPFSTDANATDVGDLLTNRTGAGGQSSTTHGYAVGGSDPGWQNQIQKYSFSVDGNSTDVGDLTSAARYPATASSTSYGYSAGGQSPAYINVINKHPFTADANATDVGDLLATTYGASGAHY